MYYLFTQVLTETKLLRKKKQQKCCYIYVYLFEISSFNGDTTFKRAFNITKDIFSFFLGYRSVIWLWWLLF